MRLVFGFMTGTSLDGLDAAAVRLSGAGLELRLVDIPATVSLEFPAALADSLRALTSGEPMPAADIARKARELGELHAVAARELTELAGPPDLACAHGQTVFHAPPDSWQLFNPWPLAREINRPLVYDLRGADLAAGGQGAPITPIADWVLFRDDRESRAIVNLGGYCNITLLPANAPPEGVIGMDVCACNHLLNAAARIALDQPFDRNGDGASRGAPDAHAVDTLAQLLRTQRERQRSLGSGDELEAALAPFASLAPHDLLASVVRAVARAIAQALCAHSPHRVHLAGGSTRNAALTSALSEELRGTQIEPTDALRVPATHREAASFAVLGALCADNVPITLPTITRCAEPAPLSGSWIYPKQR
jgi:1,6-anhydro-N-acetylmuramate kinase